MVLLYIRFFDMIPFFCQIFFVLVLKQCLENEKDLTQE